MMQGYTFVFEQVAGYLLGAELLLNQFYNPAFASSVSLVAFSAVFRRSHAFSWACLGR